MWRRQFLQSTALAGAATAQANLAAAGLAQANLAAGMQASVISDGVNLRGGPGRNQLLVGTLSAGSVAIQRSWARGGPTEGGQRNASIASYG